MQIGPNSTNTAYIGTLEENRLYPKNPKLTFQICQKLSFGFILILLSLSNKAIATRVTSKGRIGESMFGGRIQKTKQHYAYLITLNNQLVGKKPPIV